MMKIPRPKSRKVQKRSDETRGSLNNFHWKPMRCYKPWMWFATSCFRQSRTLPWKFKNAFQRHVVCWRRRLRVILQLHQDRSVTYRNVFIFSAFVTQLIQQEQFFFKNIWLPEPIQFWTKANREGVHRLRKLPLLATWLVLSGLVQPVLFVHEYQRRDDAKSLVVTSSARIRFIETWDKAEIKAIMSTFLRRPQLGSAQDNWCSWLSKYPQNIFHLKRNWYVGRR